MATRRGRRTSSLVAGAALAGIVLSGCGVIRMVPPEGQGSAHPTPTAPTAWVNSCSILTKPEVEAALAAASSDPVLYLGTSGDNRYGNSCIWKVGRISRVSTWTDGTHHGPELDEYETLEKIEGIGRSAYLADNDPNTVEIYGHSRDGVGFFVVVSKVGASTAELRSKAIELAGVVATRMEERFPGAATALPDSPPAAHDVCGLLPVAERVRLLGWASNRETNGEDASTVAEPFVGGPGGGGHSCAFSHISFMKRVEVEVTAGAAGTGDVAPGGTPLPDDALGRPAVYEPFLPAEEAPGTGYRNARLVTVLDDGRAIVVSLRDPDLDDAEHRRLLVGLMQVALRDARPG